MHYLEMMEIVMTALEYMQAGKRTQVNRSKLKDVRQIASMLLLGIRAEEAPMFSIVIEDLVQALGIAEKVNMDVLPDLMKEAIVEALYRIKEEIAVLSFKHFTVNEFSFQEGDEVFKLMREVVKTKFLGGDSV